MSFHYCHVYVQGSEVVRFEMNEERLGDMINQINAIEEQIADYTK